MMTVRVASAALVLATLLWAGRAGAQERGAPRARVTEVRAGNTNGVEFGLFLGAHGFSPDTTLGRITLLDPLTGEAESINTTPGTGVPLGLRLGFRFEPRVALELEGEVQAVDTRDQRGNGAVFGYRVNLMWRLAGASSQFRPFVLAGIGAHTSILSRSLDTDTDTALAGTFGGGLELAFTREWALRLDVRTLVGAGAGDAPYAADFEVLIGFCFSGRGACGFEPRGLIEDGIGDGGPPQRDSDDDGVFGDADRCPVTPEDADGVQDADGCPDIDDDGDGIVEIDDRCPHEAENKNGWEDADGCPEVLPEGLAAFDGIVPGLRFRPGTAGLDSSSFDTLDALAAGLKEYQDLRVKIIVHTARTAPDRMLQKTSDERAEAVRQYLLDKGIDGGRIEAIGVGADTPVANNDTAEGREQNERVEIRFVPAD